MYDNLQDDGLRDSSKIAAFDFDGCLAKTDVKRYFFIWSHDIVINNAVGFCGSMDLIYFTRNILSKWYYCCCCGCWCRHLTYIMCFWLLRNLSFSFRVGANEWTIMHPSIPDKLQSLYNDGYKLVCPLFLVKTVDIYCQYLRTSELLYETLHVACSFVFVYCR